MKSMNDSVWVILRAVLMVGCGFAAGAGYGSMDQLTPIVEMLPTLINAGIAFGNAGWAIYVRWNTRAVPAATAARKDVPTISAATGAVEPGRARTSP